MNYRQGERKAQAEDSRAPNAEEDAVASRNADPVPDLTRLARCPDEVPARRWERRQVSRHDLIVGWESPAAACGREASLGQCPYISPDEYELAPMNTVQDDAVSWLGRLGRRRWRRPMGGP